MQLVEQHRIDRHDTRWATIDAAAFASKNLYNAALYHTRQAYIKDHTILSYGQLDKLMQSSELYHALPAKVAQWVVKQVCLAWKSYFASCAQWEAHPEKSFGHPKLPKYRDKQGRNCSPIPSRPSVGIPGTLAGLYHLGCQFASPPSSPFQTIAQVRIVPHATHYTVEVVYEQKIIPADVDPAVGCGHRSRRQQLGYANRKPAGLHASSGQRASAQGVEPVL